LIGVHKDNEQAMKATKAMTATRAMKATKTIEVMLN